MRSQGRQTRNTKGKSRIEELPSDYCWQKEPAWIVDVFSGHVDHSFAASGLRGEKKASWSGRGIISLWNSDILLMMMISSLVYGFRYEFCSCSRGDGGNVTRLPQSFVGYITCPIFEVWFFFTFSPWNAKKKDIIANIVILIIETISAVKFVQLHLQDWNNQSEIHFLNSSPQSDFFLMTSHLITQCGGNLLERPHII